MATFCNFHFPSNITVILTLASVTPTFSKRQQALTSASKKRKTQSSSRTKAQKLADIASSAIAVADSDVEYIEDMEGT
jgi:hypothetical protein